MKTLDELRKLLVEEANNSPMLLSDLAGLEEYVSESYNCRSFIELLQNADDAGASRFCVKRCNNYLLVANDGRPFTIEDVESLCRSASSTKTRGKTIGYRGIGFKSVVSFAKEIFLISGEFEIAFSKEQSKRLIPQASRVPLIRIPHSIPGGIKNDFINEVIDLKNKGFNTVFVFSGALSNQIQEEYTSFASTTLLFLNSIKCIQIDLDKIVNADIRFVKEIENKRHVKIVTKDSESEWLVCSGKDCCIAFSIKDGHINRLSNSEAIIHAFLPTEDTCGLGVIVNGDFSTDPSRRHLIFDETTNQVIANLTTLYGSLLRNYLFDSKHSYVSLINALIPYYDVKLIQIMKQSFEKEFVIMLKRVLSDAFSTIKVCPNWINAVDYFKIMGNNMHTIAPQYYEIKGLAILLKYLGGHPDCVEEVIQKIGDNKISVTGYAQIISAGVKEILMNNLQINGFISTPLFLSKGELYSLQKINELGLQIDDSFVQLLVDNGVSRSELGQCFKKLSMTELQKQFNDEDAYLMRSNTFENKDEGNRFSTSVGEWFNSVPETQPKAKTITSIQRWRSAEENALNALNANGFRLKDVSSQNVGYDLEGVDPNGNDIYIEVKSVDYAGQKFRMTNNEFAAAQYKQKNYFIAIVLQNKDVLEISLINNPVNSLDLKRQCVQWVWECADYHYNPMCFSLS